MINNEPNTTSRTLGVADGLSSALGAGLSDAPLSMGTSAAMGKQAEACGVREMTRAATPIGFGATRTHVRDPSRPRVYLGTLALISTLAL